LKNLLLKNRQVIFWAWIAPYSNSRPITIDRRLIYTEELKEIEESRKRKLITSQNQERIQEVSEQQLLNYCFFTNILSKNYKIYLHLEIF
jgi:hypothetical protein